MDLLVRRDVAIVGSGPEVEVLAEGPPPSRLGQPWLELLRVDLEPRPRLVCTRPAVVTPPEFCDSWGRCDPRRGFVVLRRRALASLWGDPLADYLLQNQPTTFHATSGALWLRDDVWHDAAPPRLLSGEWLPPGMVACSRDGRRVAFTSTIPHTWGVGDLLISVIDLAARTTTRFGPWERGAPDLLEWAPCSTRLLFGHTDAQGDDYAHVLDVEAGLERALAIDAPLQGFAFDPSGAALAVTHRGSQPGITIYDGCAGPVEYPIGLCWTPTWAGREHVLYGAPAADPSPGDRIMALDLRTHETVELCDADRLGERLMTSMRISDACCARVPNEVPWITDLVRDKPVAAPIVADPRSLSAEARRHVHAKLELLFYDDLELYSQLAHLW